MGKSDEIPRLDLLAATIQIPTMVDRTLVLNDGRMEQVGTPMICIIVSQASSKADVVDTPSMTVLDVTATDTFSWSETTMRDLHERFSLAGRTALVTGASRGIGAEICTVFAEAGADIVAVARDTDALGEVADAVRSRGQRCTVLPCDLLDPAAIETLAGAARQQVGHIDILVNNAGVARVAPALELSLQDWDDTFAVNVRAAFQLSCLLAPAMIERQAGKIINVSSQAGVIALAEHAAYSASKAAVNGLTRGLMVEWAPHNIQVNTICPTIILTPMGLQVWGDKAKSQPMLDKTPLGRFGEPVEVADLALFLASPASDLINGDSIMIDGGFSAV